MSLNICIVKQLMKRTIERDFKLLTFQSNKSTLIRISRVLWSITEPLHLFL